MHFVLEMTKLKPYVILSFKKNAESQSRQKEMIENTHTEQHHNNAENSEKHSLPQESSTPKNNEKDNGKYQKLMLSSIKKVIDRSLWGFSWPMET